MFNSYERSPLSFNWVLARPDEASEWRVSLAMYLHKRRTSFLSLPPKVRVRICEYALTRRGENHTNSIVNAQETHYLQIYYKASSILSAETHSQLTNYIFFLNWLKQIGTFNT